LFRVHKDKHLSFASRVTQPLQQLLELLYVERYADVIAYSNETATVFTHKKIFSLALKVVGAE
jgi:hypothetical protein